jgi:hypothetical protein
MSMDVNRQAAMLRAQEQQAAQRAFLQLQQQRVQMEAQRAQQQSAYNALMMQKGMHEQQSAQQAQGGVLGAVGGFLGSIL